MAAGLDPPFHDRVRPGHPDTAEHDLDPRVGEDLVEPGRVPPVAVPDQILDRNRVRPRRCGCLRPGHDTAMGRPLPWTPFMRDCRCHYQLGAKGDSVHRKLATLIRPAAARL